MLIRLLPVKLVKPNLVKLKITSLLQHVIYPLVGMSITICDSQLPSDRVDRDTGGKPGPRLKMSLKLRKSFIAYVPIHLHCPDPPSLMEAKMKGI